MPEQWLYYWIALKEFALQPTVSAALAAMAMAALKLLSSVPPKPKRKLWEIPMVGIASYGLVPFSVSVGADPSWASGIGAAVGYIGLVKLEDRLDKFLGIGRKR